MLHAERAMRATVRFAREVALVSTGFAVLTYQELQVRRSEAERSRRRADAPDA